MLVTSCLLGFASFSPAVAQPFTPTGSLKAARYRHTATLLPSGKVLIAGGFSGAATASVELYDPASGSFSNAGSLRHARSYQTATLLPNGKVLYVGGITNSGPIIASAELYDPSTGTSTLTGSLSAPRYFHTATLLAGGQVLITGGAATNNSTQTSLATAELYDPSMGSFAPIASLKRGRVAHQATLLSNGKVLITGGRNGDLNSGVYESSSELYDPFTGTFTLSGAMSDGRQYHTATLLQNGKVLIIGGYNNVRGALAIAELYDPTTGTFAPGGSLTTGRYWHETTLLADGKVLVTGGFNNGTLSMAELYNPATNAFVLSGSMGNARYDHTATLLPDGKLLLVAGVTRTALAGAELYDPNGRTFPEINSLNKARFNHTATLLPNGKVLITGGYGDTAPYPMSSAELYDPTTRTFTTTGSMAMPRYKHTATLLPTGQVLVTGGRNSYTGPAILASAELYDPAAGTFSSAPSLSTARADHTATLLPTGKVLIAGGNDTSSGLSSAELYDPETNSFNATGSMKSARAYHTATLLDSGKVLVAGGGIYSSYQSSSLSSAQLYDPATGVFSSTGTMSEMRGQHTATLLDSGLVLIVGGVAGGTYNTPVMGAELYNPATGAFVKTGFPNIGRFQHTATLLQNGKVLVAGGYTGSSGNYLASAELYDAATGLFGMTGSMNRERGNHTATLLPNGQVLIVGGNTSLAYLRSAELYSPNSAPVATSLAITPAPPFTDSTLLANLTANDPEGDAFTTNYIWKKNGQVIAGESARTLDLSKTGVADRGDVLSVVVVLSDSPVTRVSRESAPVTVINSAPVVASVSVLPASPATNSVLEAEVTGSDADGDALTFTYAWSKNDVVLEAETSSSLDLSKNGNGDQGDKISLAVTVNDGQGGTTFKQAETITIVPSAPTAIALSQSVIQENQPSGTTIGTFSTTDLDADSTFTYSLVSGEGDSDNGVFQIDGDQLQAKAAFDFESKASYSIRVRSTDEEGLTIEQTFTIAIVNVNEAPTAAVTLAPLGPTTNQVLQASVTSNDAEGDTVTYSYQWKNGESVLEGQSGPTLDLSTANNGNKGDTITVVVVPSDASLSGASASASVTVSNSAPTLPAATFSVQENSTLSSQIVAQDADQDALTFSAATLPRYGTLAVQPNGAFTYTPRSNWNGTDGFQARVQDGSGARVTTIITLGVVATNGVPTATNDVVKGVEDTPVTLEAATLLRNDSNGENRGEADALKIIRVAVPTGFPGTLKLDYAKQTIVFTPKLNWNGTTNFAYTVQDSGKATASAQVTLQIAPVNDAPVALPGRLTVLSGTLGELALAGSDVENDPWTFALATKPANGNAQVVRVGEKWVVRYQSKIGFVGTDPLTVIARYGRLNSAPATITVFVNRNTTPQLVGLAPNRGTFAAGATVVFEQKVRDANGTAHLDASALLIGNFPTAANARGGATLWFDAVENRFTLTKDDGVRTFAPVALGSALENSQMKVTLAAGDVRREANGTLILRWRVSFKPTYMGTKSLWMRVEDLGGLSAGFTKAGDITLAPAANSTTPSAPQS